MPDDLSDLEGEFRINLCVESHRDTCNCANPADVPLCECGHARYRHWGNYVGMSGCGKKAKCTCENYRPAHPMPVARVVQKTWWIRICRFFTKERT